MQSRHLYAATFALHLTICYYVWYLMMFTMSNSYPTYSTRGNASRSRRYHDCYDPGISVHVMDLGPRARAMNYPPHDFRDGSRQTMFVDVCSGQWSLPPKAVGMLASLRWAAVTPPRGAYPTVGAKYENDLEPCYVRPRGMTWYASAVEGPAPSDRAHVPRSPCPHGAIGAQPPAESAPAPILPGFAPARPPPGLDSGPARRDPGGPGGRPSLLATQPPPPPPPPVEWRADRPSAGAHTDSPITGGAPDASAHATHAHAPAVPAAVARKQEAAAAAKRCQEKGAAQQQPITTLMICNIPCCVSQSHLAGIVDGGGFAQAYDYLYLPMPTHGGCAQNLGYGFINFVATEAASRFTEQFHGHVFGGTASLKEMQVKPARVQGLAANIRNFRRGREVVGRGGRGGAWRE